MVHPQVTKQNVMDPMLKAQAAGEKNGQRFQKLM